LVGSITVVFVSFVLSAAGMLVYNHKANRVISFLFGTVICLAFVFLLTFQVVGAAMVGEWNPSRGDTDASISSSMDYLPGQVIAAFGLTTVASSLPLLEAFHSTEKRKLLNDGHTRHYIAGYSWGRAARILTSAISAVGLTWVTLSPMMNPKMQPFVDEKQLANWNGFHYTAAFVAFGALFAFLLIAVADHVRFDNGTWRLSSVISMFMSIFSFVVLATTRYLESVGGIKNQWTSRGFSAAEFGMILAMFPALISRFNSADVRALHEAMIAWGKHLEEIKKNHRSFSDA